MQHWNQIKRYGTKWSIGLIQSTILALPVFQRGPTLWNNLGFRDVGATVFIDNNRKFD
jgi:hypothetical protein